MARKTVGVSYKAKETSRIPDDLIEGATFMMDLQARGFIKAVGERLQIRRQGGYSGLDAWLLLLLFFSAGPGRGVRAFWDLLREHVLQLAALADRRRLPSPASLSRILDAVEVNLLRGASSWLLVGGTQGDELLRHPSVQTYDARGQGWHVFDLDPTVTTLHQRALPEDDDLPEPCRRSRETGAPGHSGRKRGALQFRRVTVQHAGSGAWVHAHLSPGNGDGVVDFERALDTVVQTCKRLDHARDRTLVRMDGEYGNVPWFTACRERKLPFVTRLNRPKLYTDPDVLERLRSARWYEVPDSKAGPRRAAADIGTLTVAAGERTRRPDGSTYAPVTVRVVASIFPKKGEAKRGRTLEGWQVELFAVDLPEDGWPAPEAIAAYFGRTAEENRFAQEDRELGLDRIISYHLPGQELATVVGLSLWNLRLFRGFGLDPPPTKRPVQALRRAQRDERVPQGWPHDPVLRDALAEIDWAALLASWPGWSWDPATGELRCEDERPLTLTTIRRGELAEGRTGIIFRRVSGGCEACSARQACLRSTQERASKHAELSIPTPVADQLRHRLRLVRNRPGAIGASDAAPGPCAVADALFLPAAARQLFGAAFSGATLRIEVELPPPPAPKPRLVAVDVADRQRRRKTWAQNVDRYALPDGTQVRIEVAASDALRRMLGEREPSKRAAAGAA